MGRSMKGKAVHAPSLQRFTLEDLAPFTKEGAFSAQASRTSTCSTWGGTTCTGS